VRSAVDVPVSGLEGVSDHMSIGGEIDEPVKTTG